MQQNFGRSLSTVSLMLCSVLDPPVSVMGHPWHMYGRYNDVAGTVGPVALARHCMMFPTCKATILDMLSYSADQIL
jgi:hypothetical protein